MALLDYQHCSSPGDIVMIEDNSVLGIVTMKGTDGPGMSLHIKVYPFTNFIHRWYLALTGKLDFYGKQIDYSNMINPVKMVQGKVYQM